MKRKAILIESSNVSGLKDLPGARVDVENWKSFLRSDLGGAWDDREIVILRKPTSSDVDVHLKVDSDCYCFVAFSGHGCDGSVALNDAWVRNGYPVSSLKPKSSQGTLIIDSCRGLDEAVIRNFSLTKTAFANEAGHAVALNARQGRGVIFASSSELAGRLQLEQVGATIKPRSVWEGALKKCPGGVVEMLACAKGQSAGENPLAGGYYTSLLMQSADLWNQSFTIDNCQTTKQAHDYAAGSLPPQQTPEYRPSSLAFPFGVKV